MIHCKYLYTFRSQEGSSLLTGSFQFEQHVENVWGDCASFPIIHHATGPEGHGWFETSAGRSGRQHHE